MLEPWLLQFTDPPCLSHGMILAARAAMAAVQTKPEAEDAGPSTFLTWDAKHKGGLVS